MGGTNTGRRTQRERREATVAKLLQATIDTVAEVGYARTTINQVCMRSGVSQGGLFRHFATREDLVVAAAEEVARRQLSEVRARLASVTFDSDGLEIALRVMRDAIRAPMNTVFHELIVAARTDAGLAERVRPFAVSYFVQIYELAAEVFGVESDPDRSFELVLFGVLALFEGEAAARTLVVDPDLEERRLQWLVSVAETSLGLLPRTNLPPKSRS